MSGKSKNGLYDKIAHIQKLAWVIDDYIDQSTLFELQECICNLALEVAQKENRTEDLISDFPFLYKIEPYVG